MNGVVATEESKEEKERERERERVLMMWKTDTERSYPFPVDEVSAFLHRHDVRFVDFCFSLDAIDNNRQSTTKICFVIPSLSCSSQTTPRGHRY